MPKHAEFTFPECANVPDGKEFTCWSLKDRSDSHVPGDTADGSIINTVSGGTGTTATLPSPTQTAQWLDGWYTAETGGTKIGNSGASFTVPSSDTTYYAHWNPKYGVSYHANGGTVSVEGAIYEGTPLMLPTPTANIELFAQWSDNILVTFDGTAATSDETGGGNIWIFVVIAVCAAVAAGAGFAFFAIRKKKMSAK